MLFKRFLNNLCQIEFPKSTCQINLSDVPKKLVNLPYIVTDTQYINLTIVTQTVI